MFSELLTLALALEPDLEVVGSTSDMAEVAEELGAEGVDVVVMESEVRGGDGVERVRSVKAMSPGTKVLLVCESPTLEVLVRAAAAGADGFLARDSSLGEIMAAVRSDAEGLQIRGDTLEALRLRVSAEGEADGRSWDPRLTHRERDVLALLAEGLDPQTIAAQLGVTVHTSRSYVRNVLAKLGAHSQLEAVIIAARCGIVHGLCTCEHRRATTERRAG